MGLFWQGLVNIAQIFIASADRLPAFPRFVAYVYPQHDFLPESSGAPGDMEVESALKVHELVAEDICVEGCSAVYVGLECRVTEVEFVAVFGIEREEVLAGVEHLFDAEHIPLGYSVYEHSGRGSPTMSVASVSLKLQDGAGFNHEAVERGAISQVDSDEGIEHYVVVDALVFVVTAGFGQMVEMCTSACHYG